jgi:hypothetical protein
MKRWGIEAMTAHPCRSCGAPLRDAFADLGVQPISNAFRTAEEQSFPETFYPLRAMVCAACFLVQLEDHGPREAHFNAEYVYFSSFSDTWQAHARDYAIGMIARFGLGPDSRVVELASNDGYLLRYFKDAGIPCLGVDPSASVAHAAIAAGIDTRIAFFGRGFAADLLAEGFAADLMPANNVLAHVPGINDFVDGVRILLKPSGVATFEFPHVMNLIREAQFDTIYHEHYSYLSLTALMPLFRRHGLAVFDVETLATHGGSLRVFVAPEKTGREVCSRVAACLEEEAASGLADVGTYLEFGARIRGVKRALLMLLCGLKEGGARIAAYGAPAKGNTLLNYAGIRNDFIDFTVDRNPVKQGMFLPGTGIPVLPVETIQERKPDYLLILPWNLTAEIMAQQAGIAAWGGKFIVPLPVPGVVDPAGGR